MKTLLATIAAVVLLAVPAVASASTHRLGLNEGRNAARIAAQVFADTMTPAKPRVHTNCWRVNQAHIRCFVKMRAGKLRVHAGSHVRLARNGHNVMVFLRHVLILDQ